MKVNLYRKYKENMSLGKNPRIQQPVIKKIIDWVKDSNGHTIKCYMDDET